MILLYGMMMVVNDDDKIYVNGRNNIIFEMLDQVYKKTQKPWLQNSQKIIMHNFFLHDPVDFCTLLIIQNDITF